MLRQGSTEFLVLGVGFDARFPSRNGEGRIGASPRISRAPFRVIEPQVVRVVLERAMA
jgi:hypothetical protein